jgi:hypothetical protein
MLFQMPYPNGRRRCGPAGRRPSCLPMIPLIDHRIAPALQGKSVEAPFALLWARYNLARPCNHGCFGVKLRQLVCGAMELALISNYQIDFPWLMSACPELCEAKKVIVAHGWTGTDAKSMSDSVTAATKGWGREVRTCR